MPSSRSPNYGSKFQHGGALLVMLVILVMGITTVFVTSLSGTAIQNHRNHSSADALAKAKEALIGYAVTFGDTPTTKSHGYLPCPDLNGDASSPKEGSSDLCGTSDSEAIGRLPWRTLDLPALFDGAGECLWYAVSGNYKSTRSSPPLLNWDNPGQLHVYDIDGVTEINPGEIVAVVIAPGAPLSSNTDRAGNNAPTCGGNYTPSAYLENDTVHGKNNADISQASFILPHKDSDTVSTNDQLVFITRQDIWNAIQKRIVRQAKKCLDDYASDAANTNHKYPWAVKFDDITASPNRTGSKDVRFGRFPDVPNTTTSGGSGYTPSEISALTTKIQNLQDALDAYLDGTGSLWNVRDKGDKLKDFVKVAPYNQTDTSFPIYAAGRYADNCNSVPSPCSTTTLSSMITAAFNDLSGSDSSMPSSWTSISSCQQLINSSSWPAWRDWVFVQIADGYQPGGTGSCTSGTTCLSVTGSGNTNAGSGSYHAAVVAASKALLTQNPTTRTTTPSDITQFLDKDPSPGALLGDNQTGKVYTPTSTSFVTYRASDTNFNTINDMVLCIDGKNNCQ